MYRQRTLERTIKAASRSFPVVFISGPRQVGKTTLLKKMLASKGTYVTLDDALERVLAHEDPALFLQRYSPPVLIDEIQYAPALFPHIKMMVDNNRVPGLFWLTGSQQFHLMKNLSESLAGRVGILNLLGFSLSEERGAAASSQPFLPDLQLLKKKATHSELILLPALYKKIWRGSFPMMVLNHGKDWEIFYRSYVQTYLQRDLRDFAQIGNQRAFIHFLRACAVRTAQLINYADLARDVGVSQPTIKSWLAILQASGIIYILEPFHANRYNRLVKTAKLYFLDTGLCSFLSGWSSDQVLERGAMSGPMFETFVVSEIIKSYWHNGKEAPIFFYRDHDNVEVDLLIEQNGTLYPIEIKKTASPGKDVARNFAKLNHLAKIGPGAVICLTDKPRLISAQIEAIPIGYL